MDSIMVEVENLPVFPGGESAMFEYIGSNIIYPEEAKNNNIQGRVYVGFIVEKDGTLSNIEILRGIGAGCDAEVVRIVQSMPNWTPGYQNEKPVRVQFTLPVVFALEGKSKRKKNK